MKNSEVKYDKNGFDENGFHKETGTWYDPEGYMKDGYNRLGWNRHGYNKESKDIYDKHGFDETGIHQDTHLKQDDNGFIQSGFNRKTKSFYGLDGYDIDGYDSLGFNKLGINKKTGTRYTKRGFDASKHHKETGTFYDLEGYDAYGFDENGFNKNGYDKNGYDIDGYNSTGFNERGYNRDGLTAFEDTRRKDKELGRREKILKGDFRVDGTHMGTKTKYDYQGYDKDGYDKDGYRKTGYDRNGYDKAGFDVHKIHEETGTKFDPEGYDIHGINKLGFDRNGVIAPELKKAIEFLVYDGDIVLFAKINGYTPTEVKEGLKKIEEYPKLLEAIHYTLSNSSIKKHYEKSSKKEQILNNNITPESLYSIEKTLADLTPKEMEVAMENIFKYVKENEISMMDYKKMFDLELNDKFVDNVQYSLKTLLNKRDNKAQNPKVHEIYRRIISYKTPYVPNQHESLGYVDEKGKTVMVEITPELRELAEKYLKLTDEYICQKTMKKTMMAIIKGKLTPEMIDEIEPKKESNNYVSKEEINLLVDDFIDDFKLDNNIKSEVSVKTR